MSLWVNFLPALADILYPVYTTFKISYPDIRQSDFRVELPGKYYWAGAPAGAATTRGLSGIIFSETVERLEAANSVIFDVSF